MGAAAIQGPKQLATTGCWYSHKNELYRERGCDAQLVPGMNGSGKEKLKLKRPPFTSLTVCLSLFWFRYGWIGGSRGTRWRLTGLLLPNRRRRGNLASHLAIVGLPPIACHLSDNSLFNPNKEDHTIGNLLLETCCALGYFRTAIPDTLTVRLASFCHCACAAHHVATKRTPKRNKENDRQQV